MSMSLRLSEEAVISGSIYQISPEALAALQSGDTRALIRSHAERFGGWKMEEDDDSEDDDGDDDAEDGDDEEVDEDEDSDDEDDEDSPEGKKSKKKKGSEDDSSTYNANGMVKALPKTMDGAEKVIRAQQDTNDRLHRVVTKARSERDDALAEVERLTKAAPGDEDLKKEVQDLKAKNDSLQTENRNALMRISFLADNTYEWVNPGQALRLVDLSNIEVDDDGKVLGMKEALEALAESSPHLLKPKRPAKPGPKPGASGSKPTPPAKKTAAAKKAQIAAKYKIQR